MTYEKIEEIAGLLLGNYELNILSLKQALDLIDESSKEVVSEDSSLMSEGEYQRMKEELEREKGKFKIERRREDKTLERKYKEAKDKRIRLPSPKFKDN